MKRLKIVHIIQSLVTGGGEKLLVDLCLNSCKNHDVTVISQYPEGGYQYEKLLQENGIEVIYLNKKKGFNIGAFFELCAALKTINPDVVHTHLHAAIYAILYYMINKKCVKIHTLHNIATVEFDKPHRKIQKFAYKHLGVTPVAICHTVKQTFEDEYGIKNIPIIYNGIDVKKYSVLNKTFPKEFVIVNVASFSKRKNQILLVNAYKKAIESNSNMRLLFIGDGAERPEVMSMAKDTPSIEFIGVSDEVDKYLNEASAFCLCSFFEGLPLSILEAYAAGLPVIATDVGGIKDILENEKNGYLVPSDDVNAL
ncbi:MAG: glycosyltransferase, partial [Oscillospiraceae bacterium]